MKNRIIFAIIGCFIIAFGITVIVELNYGMPAFDTFILVLAAIVKIEYTTALRMVQGILLLILICFKKKLSVKWNEIFVTAFSVLLVTVLIDVARYALGDIIVKNYLWLFIGFITFVYGITLLVQSDVLLAPNDKLLNAISHITTHSYALYKIITDVILLAIAIFLIKKNGYDIGISLVTVLLTFFTGPFVGLFCKINRFIIRKIGL